MECGGDDDGDGDGVERKKRHSELSLSLRKERIYCWDVVFHRYVIL